MSRNRAGTWEKLAEKYGKKFKNEFFAPGETELGERIIVMVNGRRVEFLEGIRTELKESDTVQIFPLWRAAEKKKRR